MNYEDGLQGNENRRRRDEDGRHAGKGANLFWNIQACVDFRLLQTILREFSFSTMSGFSAFR